MKIINLTQNKEAIVDDDDFRFLNSFKWFARKVKVNFYAGTKKDGLIQMHHVVCGYPLGDMVVDHINGNSLDNRRCNLRIVSQRKNVHNNIMRRRGTTWSKYPGVSLYYRIAPQFYSKWISIVKLKGKIYPLGYFENELDASIAYKNKCIELGIDYG